MQGCPGAARRLRRGRDRTTSRSARAALSAHALHRFATVPGLRVFGGCGPIAHDSVCALASAARRSV